MDLIISVVVENQRSRNVPGIRKNIVEMIDSRRVNVTLPIEILNAATMIILCFQTVPVRSVSKNTNTYFKN